MTKKYLVPFKYILEVDIDVEISETAMKHKAIAKAIEAFGHEFRNDNLNDIAHSMAPTLLTDIREVK